MGLTAFGRTRGRSRLVDVPRVVRRPVLRRARGTVPRALNGRGGAGAGSAATAVWGTLCGPFLDRGDGPLPAGLRHADDPGVVPGAGDPVAHGVVVGRRD